MVRSNYLAALVFLVTGLSGCDVNYWWSRGQPPSTKQLVERSELTLKEQMDSSSKERSDVAPIIERAHGELTAVLAKIGESGEVSGPQSSALVANFDALETTFIDLEQNLFVGSRAPYGELAGELRKIRSVAQAGEKLEYNAVGLYASRVYFFFANELQMPSPNSTSVNGAA